MTTLFITHPDCLEHTTPPGHPECPERLSAIVSAVEAAGLKNLKHLEAEMAQRDALCMAHPRDYVEAIAAAVPGEGEDIVYLDGDTVLSPGSWHAALRAAGAGMQAVDAVMGKKAKNAFCAVRPPGHHAEPNRAMGFCLFNNVVIAARHAQRTHAIDRVAILDFDVHHGNGTEEMARHDMQLFYASSHEAPLFPGTGRKDFHGPFGNIVNAPLPPKCDSAAFRGAWEALIFPQLEMFDPEFIIISAGFDGHVRDPLASLGLETQDFAWITREITAFARRNCKGRVVSMLEGGYDLDALAESSVTHLRELISA